jgi:hypothetical protein
MHWTVTNPSVVDPLGSIIPYYDSESLCLQKVFLENSVTRTRYPGTIRFGTGRALAGVMDKVSRLLPSLAQRVNEAE